MLFPQHVLPITKTTSFTLHPLLKTQIPFYLLVYTLDIYNTA